jgi:solute carrier family 25 carnitine/acylcarnitine transporter 20/29
MSKPKVSPWKDFVAGTVGGAAGIVAGHPFDTVKVRIQTSPEEYKGTFSSLIKIAKNEGITGLYKGMATPVMGVGFLSAICFGVYGNALRWLETKRGQPRSKFEYYTDVFIAGSISGTIVCFIACPSENIKIRLQLQEDAAKKLYNGPFDCTRKIYKAEGMRGIFRGMAPTLLRDAGPGYGSYFLFYEMLKDWWGTSPVALLTAGGLAGVCSWFSSYPFDVVKTRIQSVPTYPQPGWDRYKGFWDCTKKCYREEGVKVFFRGLNSCLWRSFPVNGKQFQFMINIKL